MRAILIFLTAATLLASVAARTDRSAAELHAFQRANPCPSTGQHRGACPGYQIDHIEPLCAQGVDKPHNMQWLTIEEHRYKTATDVRVCAQLRRAQ